MKKKSQDPLSLYRIVLSVQFEARAHRTVRWPSEMARWEVALQKGEMDTGTFPVRGSPSSSGTPRPQPRPQPRPGCCLCFTAKRPNGPLASWCSVCGEHESAHSAAVGDASAGSLAVNEATVAATAAPTAAPGFPGLREEDAEEGRSEVAVDPAAASQASVSPALPPPSHRPPPRVAVFDFDLTLTSMHVGIFDAGNRDRVFGTPQRVAMLRLVTRWLGSILLRLPMTFYCPERLLLMFRRSTYTQQ